MKINKQTIRQVNYEYNNSMPILEKHTIAMKYYFAQSLPITVLASFAACATAGPT